MKTELMKLLMTEIGISSLDEIMLGGDVSKDNLCLFPVAQSNWSLKPKSLWKDIYWPSIKKINEGYKGKPKQKDFFRLYPNRDDFSELKELTGSFKIKGIIMEPTGCHYSGIFALMFKHLSIENKWLGHAQLKADRISAKLPDKNDLIDALLLGIAGWKHWDDDNYFVMQEIEKTQELRQFVYRYQFLNRFKNPLENRIKQNLMIEFPEAGAMRSVEKKDGSPPPLIEFLSGTGSKFYDRLLEKSISSELGIEISDHSKQFAIWDEMIRAARALILDQIEVFLRSDEFVIYNKVFQDFGFDSILAANILILIHPLEKFSIILPNGNRKWLLPQYKSFLGFGMKESSSGDIDRNSKKPGRTLLKAKLYLFLIRLINPRIPSAPCLQDIKSYYDNLMKCYNMAEWSAQNPSTPRKDLTKRYHLLVAMRASRKIVEKLFWRLVQELK